MPATPEARPELVTKCVDTADLALSPVLNSSGASNTPILSDGEQVDDGGVLSVSAPDQIAYAQGSDAGSVDSSSGGSLRNRHVRVRTEQSTDLGGLFQAPPATESDPLLAHSGISETSSAISLSDRTAGPTRSWRAALMALRTVICIVVVGALVLLAKDRLFNLPAHPGWPAIHRNAVESLATAQLPLAMAVPDAADAIDPIYISVISTSPPPPPQDVGPIRFRVRAKHGDEASAEVSERQEDAPTTVTSVMSNEGTHSFAAPTDAAPLLGWLYKSVIGSVLELLGF
ncbi:hypothetical protein GGI20_005503 [Coemansia sp. BCRC 34301]|nr:hypothetical protein GGI20_005503 [Coemansia sp. BCRC 34301]